VFVGINMEIYKGKPWENGPSMLRNPPAEKITTLAVIN